MKPRAAAVQILTQVLGQGRSLSSLLPELQEQIAQPADRAFAQQLCFGVLRFLPRLESCASRHLRRPLKARDRDIHVILLLGLYQLIYLRTPDHAAVSETVALTRSAGKPWARGLVNAVLRGFLREREKTLAEVDRDEAIALAHPRWLFEMLRADWPDEYRTIAEANNRQPPMVLRVNRLRVERSVWLQRARVAGVEGSAAPFTESGVVLRRPWDVAALPGFSEGEVSVQDAAAQLAVDLLDLRPGQRVLDACAAPGGKTAHIAEREPRLAELVAVDVERKRLQRVEENLRRLGLRAHLVEGDARDPASWWDGNPFDRILLDAPCSATGVIRRHPDIKVLRRADDIPEVVVKQQQLLESMWSLLNPGGILLYVTCSVLKRENVRQITDFVESHPDARELPITGEWGRVMTVGRQVLPDEHQMDGFYYACLRKER